MNTGSSYFYEDFNFNLLQSVMVKYESLHTSTVLTNNGHGSCCKRNSVQHKSNCNLTVLAFDYPVTGWNRSAEQIPIY